MFRMAFWKPWKRLTSPPASIYEKIKAAADKHEALIITRGGRQCYVCPHVVGRKRESNGRIRENCLFYQWDGYSESGLGPDGSRDNWRCIHIDEIESVVVLPKERWHTVDTIPSKKPLRVCVDDDKIDVRVKWAPLLALLLISSPFAATANGDAPSPCDPAVETQISGDYSGWDSEVIYKMTNGQIWQQSSYHYHYHYAYRPEVVIYPTKRGCHIKVEGDDDGGVDVTRLK